MGSAEGEFYTTCLHDIYLAYKRQEVRPKVDWFRNWAKVGEEVRRTKKKERNRKMESEPRKRLPELSDNATRCPRGGRLAQAQTTNNGKVTAAFVVAQVIEQPERLLTIISKPRRLA